jgi:hypothetical protein
LDLEELRHQFGRHNFDERAVISEIRVEIKAMIKLCEGGTEILEFAYKKDHSVNATLPARVEIARRRES